MATDVGRQCARATRAAHLVAGECETVADREGAPRSQQPLRTARQVEDEAVRAGAVLGIGRRVLRVVAQLEGEDEAGVRVH